MYRRRGGTVAPACSRCNPRSDSPSAATTAAVAAPSVFCTFACPGGGWSGFFSFALFQRGVHARRIALPTTQSGRRSRGHPFAFGASATAWTFHSPTMPARMVATRRSFILVRSVLESLPIHRVRLMAARNNSTAGPPRVLYLAKRVGRALIKNLHCF